jgi:hypothetical protein
MRSRVPIGFVELTASQISGLPSPAVGDTVFNTTSGYLNVYTSLGWAVVGANQARGEVPSGSIDGNNRAFTLTHSASPNTPQNVAVYSDGIRINPSQYTVSGTALTFIVGSVNIPENDLVVDYGY